MDSVRWDRRLDGDESQGCPMGGVVWVLRRSQSVAGVEVGDADGFTMNGTRLGTAGGKELCHDGICISNLGRVLLQNSQLVTEMSSLRQICLVKPVYEEQ